MFNNPWPFVIAALASLGFLANSMAQNKNRFEEASSQDSPFRWSGDLEERPQGGRLDPPVKELQSPFESRANLNSFDQPRRESSARNPTLRRGGELDSADGLPRVEIQDVRPLEDHRGGINSSRARSQQPIAEVDASDLETRFAQNLTLNPSGSRAADSPPVTRRGSDLERRPRDRAASSSFDETYFEDKFQTTKPASLLGQQRLIESLPANPRVFAPFKPGPDRGTNSGTVGDVLRQGSNRVSAALHGAAEPGAVPFWLTLGLFVSLPANLFFGWIAMSMHARYQDLLEDMQVSDARRSRETHRRRTFEDERPRRSREADEEAFLNGGIEV